MKNDNDVENGSFKRVVCAVIVIIIAGWISWSSFSILSITTKQAVMETQFCYIDKSLQEIKTMIGEHMKVDKR